MTEPSAPENNVPNSIAQVGVTMRYTFLDYLRSRRFAILLGIMLLISAILTVVVAHYRPASFLSSGHSRSTRGGGGCPRPSSSILSGIFFGGDAISGEFQNKTGYFTLPNPIRRSSIYVGKWLAAFIASSIVLFIFTAITMANGPTTSGCNIPWQFGESFLFAWFYLMAVLGFTFFFSSLFKSSSYSILVTAILFLFAFTLIETLYLGPRSDRAVVHPDIRRRDNRQRARLALSCSYRHCHVAVSVLVALRAPTFTSFNVTIPEGLAIIAAYFVITAILGLVLFERKEFN